MILRELMDTIRTEPEYPGEPSDELKKVFNEIIETKDLDRLVSLLRQSVRVTKISIMKRIIKQVEDEELT